jgi:hypothetical protein
VAGEVPRPRKLEERPEQVVRVRREPCDLHGRLARRDRVAEPPLHLVRVALDEHHGDEQATLAGRAGERDAAVGQRDRVVVALEVGLRPAEVVEGLEPRRELGVRQPGDEIDRLVAVLAGRRDPARRRLAEGEDRRRGRDQHAVVELARGLERAAPALDRLVEVELVEAVDRELDLQRRGLRALAVGQVLPRPQQPPVGVLVAAEPVLDRRAHPGELHPPGGGPGREQLAGLQQGGAAALEVAERALRRRERDAQLDVALAVAARQQPQRRLVPMHGRGGVARRGDRARLEQDRDRGLVARGGRLLDVVGALGRARPALGQRRRRPGVRGQAPTTARRLVHRAAHERVAEDEAPRHARRPDEVEREQVVERGEPVGLRELADHRRQSGLERLAGDGGRVEQRARVGRQRRELLRDRGRHRRGERAVVRAVRRRGGAAAARELLEVERVAAAVAVDRRDVGGADAVEQRGRLLLGQRLEDELVDPRVRERGQQPCVGLRGTRGEREQDRRVGAAAHERRDELDRRAVAPMQVVEDEHERLRVREQGQQRLDRVVGAIALVGDRRGARARATHRREDRAELARQRVVPAAEGVEVLRGEVRVEGIDPHAERHVALELGRRAAEHEMAALVGPRAQLVEQAGLADARLPLDREVARRALVERVERRLDPLDLRLAPDDPAGAGGNVHVKTLTRFRGEVRGCPS